MSGANPRPLIFFERGYWRVTPTPRPYWVNQRLWSPAYSFVAAMNSRLIDARREAAGQRQALANIVNHLTRQL